MSISSANVESLDNSVLLTTVYEKCMTFKLRRNKHSQTQPNLTVDHPVIFFCTFLYVDCRMTCLKCDTKAVGYSRKTRMIVTATAGWWQCRSPLERWTTEWRSCRVVPVWFACLACCFVILSPYSTGLADWLTGWLAGWKSLCVRPVGALLTYLLS